MITWWQIAIFILFFVGLYIYMRVQADKNIKKQATIISRNELPDLPPAKIVSFEGLLNSNSAKKTITLFEDQKKTEMLVLRADGGDVLHLWTELRAIVHLTRLWPVIIGTKDDVDDLKERLSPGYFDEVVTTESILNAAASISPSQWFADRPGNNSYYEIEEGTWTDNALTNNVFIINIDTLLGKPLDEVYMILVPTTEPWEVPAYLRFGWGNENPSPEEHVAVLKHWHDQYGAEVVSLKYAFLELRVTRPPDDRKRSMELAQEQFIYCPDNAHELGDISALGSHLYRSRAWNFWWD